MVNFTTVFCLAGAALAAGLAQAASLKYTLVDNFDSTNFFNEFQFFTDTDPTNGAVRYVDAVTANRDSLAGYYRDSVYLGVDHTTVLNTTTKRPSVRVTSQKAYTKGLFIADIAHMPAGKTDDDACGLWPAFWTVGPEWPGDGEIDILEGINTQSSSAITLHTGKECIISNNGSAPTTSLFNDSCNGKIGCRQETNGKNNYGAGFNAAGGGIYVVEWTDEAISAWFFSRDSHQAASLSSSTSSSSTGNTKAASTQLDTSSFGTPVANFVGGNQCSISDNFKDQSIIINTDFCGEWAGKEWGQNPTCAALGPSCDDYVAAHPEKFEHAYWLINSIKVYKAEDGNYNASTGSDSPNKRESQRNVAGKMARGLPFIA